MFINHNNYYSNNIQFGMLKKSKLTPFKRVFCETYHPPLEKMDTVDDLTKWVEGKYEDLVKPHEKLGIEESLKPWKETLTHLDDERHRNSIYWKYLIYDNMKRLNTTYFVFPEMKTILRTIEDTKSHIKLGKEKFNFYNHYTHFLKELALNKYFPPNKEKTGWVEILGSTNPKKQAENIKTVRALSVETNWCTTSKIGSSISIENPNCGMYIYFDNGKTLYAVRTVGNMTHEIRDRHNVPIDLPEDALKSLKEKNPEIFIFRNSLPMME